MPRNNMLNYAEKYLSERVEVFRKDMAICLTPDQDERHAYFPALLTCLSFIDLASCLNIGNLDPRNGMGHVLSFANEFMHQPEYDDKNVKILWLMFRHKTAHNSQPYWVFDSHSRKELQEYDRMKIAWTVDEKPIPTPISIVPKDGAVEGISPWPSPFNHLCTISLPTLQCDIEEAILGNHGYLYALKKDQQRLDKFEKCIEEIFPK